MDRQRDDRLGRRCYTAAILNTGGRYNPSTDSWTATSTTNAPECALPSHGGVDRQRDDRLGRSYGSSDLNTGGRYNPSTDSWTATSTTNAPAARDSAHGGLDRQRDDRLGRITAATCNTGGRYNPSTDSWTATSTTNAPAAREPHTAVWTGSEMIVWGGSDGSNPLNTGGRYCAAPASNRTKTNTDAETTPDFPPRP